MADRPRIFISAVTSEFKTLRQLVAQVLERLGYEPVRQDIFGTESGDLREMLRRQIDECDGVIHIVGHGYGAEPPDVDPETGRVSYTQFEFLCAGQQSKKTWVIFPDNGCTRDKPLEDLDLPFDPDHTSRDEYQQERRKLQKAWRERLQQQGHLYHEASNDTALELKIERLKDDLAELRKSENRWRSKVVTMLGLVLVALAVIVGSIIFLAVRSPVELADTTLIRVQLEKTIEQTYQDELARIEEISDWKERDEARQAAEETYDRQLADIDDFLESVTSTIASGEASSEYLELNRVLQGQGVDEALSYVDAQWDRILEQSTKEFNDVEGAAEDLRQKLAPALESVRLFQAKGDYTSALERCDELLGPQLDPTWPEARHEHVMTLLTLGDNARRYEKPMSVAQGHYQVANDSARLIAQLNPADAQTVRDLAAAHFKLGELHSGEKFETAIEHFTSGVAILEKMIEQGQYIEECNQELVKFQEAIDECNKKMAEQDGI